LRGCHRDTSYDVKPAFQMGGVDVLVERKRAPPPIRVVPTRAAFHEEGGRQ
jgi:hypothetical protein